MDLTPALPVGPLFLTIDGRGENLTYQVTAPFEGDSPGRATRNASWQAGQCGIEAATRMTSMTTYYPRSQRDIDCFAVGADYGFRCLIVP